MRSDEPQIDVTVYDSHFKSNPEKDVDRFVIRSYNYGSGYGTPEVHIYSYADFVQPESGVRKGYNYQRFRTEEVDDLITVLTYWRDTYGKPDAAN